MIPKLKGSKSNIELICEREIVKMYVQKSCIREIPYRIIDMVLSN